MLLMLIYFTKRECFYIKKSIYYVVIKMQRESNQIKKSFVPLESVTDLPMYTLSFDPKNSTIITKETGLSITARGTDHKESMLILSMAGLEAPEKRIIFSLMNLFEREDPRPQQIEAKKYLKGRKFYLKDMGIDDLGVRTMDKMGSLQEIIEDTSPNRKIYVYPAGSFPLSVFINSDRGTAEKGWRFMLGSWNPDIRVPLVIGVDPKFNFEIERLLRQEWDENSH